MLADHAKARFYLKKMKNYFKNKITFAEPKSKYLVNSSLSGQQDLWPWHTIVQRKTFSPLQHYSLTRAKIWCQ